MQVAQRGTSVTGITGNGYNTADRWDLSFATLGTFTQSVETDAPTGTGLRKSLKMLCTTADAAPAAADRLYLAQALEGQDVQRIAKGTADAKQLTVSFWVKSNVTGTYIVALYDWDNTRSVSAAYTVSASATWEKKTVTFPADTTGTLDNDNAESLALWFVLGAGSNRTSGTLATAWESHTQANLAPGQTNLAAAINNYWQITGVQLETGSVASPFEFEPYEATLRKCQRYYYLHCSGLNKIMFMGANYSATEIDAVCHFPVPMRTGPSLTIASGTNYYRLDRNGGVDYVDAMTIGYAQEHAAGMYNNTQASGTAGDAGWMFTNNASSSIAFSAEL
jgi:hypothetical protein